MGSLLPSLASLGPLAFGLFNDCAVLQVKLLKEVEMELLANKQHTILTKEASGCAALLRDDKVRGSDARKLRVWDQQGSARCILVQYLAGCRWLGL
jgi:hypothetical protein